MGPVIGDPRPRRAPEQVVAKRPKEVEGSVIVRGGLHRCSANFLHISSMQSGSW